MRCIYNKGDLLKKKKKKSARYMSAKRRVLDLRHDKTILRGASDAHAATQLHSKEILM